MSAPESPLWRPTADRQARATITQFLAWLGSEHGLSFDGYQDLWQWSVDELAAFWASVWDFYGLRSATLVSSPLGDRRMPGCEWFRGATLNYAEHVLDRAPQDGPAIVSVGEGRRRLEISTDELRARVGALARTLRDLGVEPGDRVAAYLPNVPEAVIGMLATTSLGAIWAACAPDFGTRSVIDRFVQIEPKVLLAADGYCFNGIDHDRSAAIADLKAALPSLRATIVVRLLDHDAPAPGGALTFEETTAAWSEPTFEQVPFDHPLWILFSSGTTGLPKGIVHGHGGILVEHLKSLGLCLDIGSRDRFLFYSSTSWMAWNYLIGGLLHGATIVLYDGSPAHPSRGGLWEIGAATGATVLGMGSAYVIACQKHGVELGPPLELGALRTVIPTGSPLPPSGWRWLHDRLGGDVRIDSICGGTDVCTAFFGGSELLPVNAGEISCRWLGVDAHAVDADGEAVIGELGEFVLTSPMPSMPIELWNDPDGSRYRHAYFETFPGVWRQGDWITISATGAVTVAGRSDATLNRGGVRIGSAEIYSAVEQLPDIADSLVVGVELDDGGYYMPLFVVSECEDLEALRTTVRAAIRQELSPRHLPDEIVVAPAIPRTLTGKKLEVPVKRILEGREPERVAAAGSVDRPDLLLWFARFASERRERRAEPAETRG
ncbi:MAG TPA: acetoacetate--CoA ligase [Solirubrobacteraceae bacterium]|nr:acetoacetate--CoA ligase [Solirubrobacteraceae bacterium]